MNNKSKTSIWRLVKLQATNKFKSNQPLRTPEVAGELVSPVTPNRPVSIYTKGGGLEYGPDRLVTTSPVTKILEQSSSYIRFETNNSIYELNLIT